MADCGIQRIHFRVEAESSKDDLEKQVRDIIDAFILYPNDQVVFVYDLRDNVYCKMMKEPWEKDGGLWLCVPDIGQRVDHSKHGASRSFRTSSPRSRSGWSRRWHAEGCASRPGVWSHRCQMTSSSG
jgi:hypothetical protein